MQPPLCLAHAIPLTSNQSMEFLSNWLVRSPSHLYPMVLHILHAGHTNQCWVPAVHGFQFHVDQKVVWGSLQGDSGLQAKAQLSSAEAPRRDSNCCAWDIRACQKREARAISWLVEGSTPA